MSGLLGMAKQALDAVRKTGPDPAAQVTTPQPPPPADAKWICGLDLGMMSDYTALAVLRKTTEASNGKRINRYACLYLKRWISVDYPTIAEELRPKLATLTPAATLVADETGVGVGVLQILRRAQLPIAKLRGVTITGGNQTTFRPDGGYNVPKRELVAEGQSALQSGRLQISPKLKDGPALKKELRTFVNKIRLNATESFEAWRESDKDDLVLACCMAVWYGERGGGWGLSAEQVQKFF